MNTSKSLYLLIVNLLLLTINPLSTTEQQKPPKHKYAKILWGLREPWRGVKMIYVSEYMICAALARYMEENAESVFGEKACSEKEAISDLLYCCDYSIAQYNQEFIYWDIIYDRSKPVHSTLFFSHPYTILHGDYMLHTRYVVALAPNKATGKIKCFDKNDILQWWFHAYSLRGIAIQHCNTSIKKHMQERCYEPNADVGFISYEHIPEGAILVWKKNYNNYGHAIKSTDALISAKEQNTNTPVRILEAKHHLNTNSTLSSALSIQNMDTTKQHKIKTKRHNPNSANNHATQYQQDMPNTENNFQPANENKHHDKANHHIPKVSSKKNLLQKLNTSSRNTIFIPNEQNTTSHSFHISAALIVAISLSLLFIRMIWRFISKLNHESTFLNLKRDMTPQAEKLSAKPAIIEKKPLGLGTKKSN